jgi:catechol 2,3-dioxygenase-like lactoylglutathione lyase family enzyme
VELIHTCYRVTDPERSVAFYEALGFEKRRELPIRDEAVNFFLGVPGHESPELELTYNFETPESGYELGTGYGHIAVTADGWRAYLRVSETDDEETEAFIFCPNAPRVSSGRQPSTPIARRSSRPSCSGWLRGCARRVSHVTT